MNSLIYDCVRENNYQKLMNYFSKHSKLSLFNYKIDDYAHDVSPIPLNNLSILHVAAYFDSFECLVFLLENIDRFNYNFLSCTGFHPLEYAILGEAVECTSFLLSLGSDPNFYESSSHISPLFLAARCRNSQIIKTLFKYGAKYPNSSQISKYGRKFLPLEQAILFKRRDNIAAILNNQNDINFAKSNILLELMSRRMYEYVELFLQCGCDPNYTSLSGKTPLTLACHSKRIDLIKLFISYGASLKRVFDNGKTFLHYAAAVGDPEIIKIALKAGNSPTKFDSYGKVPMFYINNFSDYRCVECFHVLLINGANINQLYNGTHILSYVLSTKNALPILVSFLLDEGVDLDIKLSSGLTVYEMGIMIAQPQLKKILSERKIKL